MPLTAGDIRRAHERLGRPDEIVHQRRTLYSAVVDIYGGEGCGQATVGADVLDSPAVRGHLGAVLSGRSSFSPAQLRPLAELVAPRFRAAVAGCPIRVASTPAAPTVLAGALRRIASELERHGDASDPLDLLTTAADRVDELEEVYGHVVAGVRLALRLAPDLVLDLLPHIGLFAVVVSDQAARLGSASAREFPGLILIPAPRNALEVAEALVHEGAHQKFFDLGMTRSMLGARSPQAPRFRPSWAPDRAPDWPLEQSMAAWHAYRCLAVLAHSLRDSGEYSGPAPDSLLPRAAERASELGGWIRRHGSFLGPDAHALIHALEGAPPVDPWLPEVVDTALLDLEVESGGLVVRAAGNRTLVVRRGSPPDLFWMSSAPVLR